MASDENKELTNSMDKMDLINSLRQLDKSSLVRLMIYLNKENSQNLIKSAVYSLIKEKEEQESKVIKTALLKEDLYSFSPKDQEIVYNIEYLYFQKDEKEKHIRNLVDGFKLVAKKGDKFKLLKNYNEWISEDEKVVLEANFYFEEKFFTDVMEV